MNQNNKQEQGLRKVLKARHIWALAVGAVISGDYYGFSYGMEEGGPISLLVAFIPVTLMYILFILIYSDLAVNLPSAGGASEYAGLAIGRFAGYITGVSILIAYIVSPVAVAIATGQLVNYLIPEISPKLVTIIFFCSFILVNLLGTKSSSRLGLIATIAALIGIILFIVAAIPYFKASNFVTEPMLATGLKGVLKAVPFVMWFYFAIDSTMMQAEEMENPERDLLKGYIPTIITLFITALSVILLTAGIADYHKVAAVDFPLVKSLELAFEESQSGSLGLMPKAIAVIALFSMVASFSSIVMSYSRQAFAMGRAGFLPKSFTKLNRMGVPVYSLIIPSCIALVFAVLGDVSLMVTISVFAALLMYVMVVLSDILLQSKNPEFFKKGVRLPSVIRYATLILIMLVIFCIAIINFSVIKWVAVVYGVAMLAYPLTK